MNNDQNFSQELNPLLDKWEESYKKGLLSFWLLLQLHQRPSYAFEMKQLVQELSQGTITAEDNSIYRALSRFESIGIVESQVQPNQQGPDRRYFRLTDLGLRLLTAFSQRNLLVFQSEALKEKLAKVFSDPELGG